LAKAADFFSQPVACQLPTKIAPAFVIRAQKSFRRGYMRDANAANSGIKQFRLTHVSKKLCLKQFSGQ
jgi:hypothetical protein